MIQKLETLSLKSRGYSLDTDPSKFGYLNRFEEDPLEKNGEARKVFDQQGYLYLPGFWKRETVLDVRKEITGKLADRGVLVADKPTLEAFPNAAFIQALDRQKGSSTLNGVAEECESLQRLL